MQTPTTDQLRNRIDSGRTGEKIAMPDPAAAPLGTDAEAAGSPPSPAERRLEAEQTPTAGAEQSRPVGGIIYIAAIGVVAVAFIFVVVLAAS